MGYLTAPERQERLDALAERFAAGEFTETVYRASLFALGLRGEDITHEIRSRPNVERKRL